MTTLNQEEVNKFSKIADEWWDETGKFKPLHKFNPIRISYIRRKICEHFKLDEKSLTPFCKLEIIDVGCGGGLISEPFAKMKAKMTGIDASEKNINVAKIHAQKSGIEINYKQSLVENIEEKFDVVFALEVIEHVDNVDEFVKNCARIVKKNGLLFVATLNRTIKSLLMAKIGAEYVLRWLPAGTHDYKKFLKPSEIYEFANVCDLELKESCGFSYNLLKDEWKENPSDLDVNYIMVFEKK
jgi:2-polyprenyl-6-hydroxyphenyl methylase/3-demethylubiquinone-9 3-methyltransferase